MSNTPVITIDGPSGSGKGTLCRRLADTLGWHLLDSGALYRLAGYAAWQAGVDLDNAEQHEARIADIALAMDIEFASHADGSEKILLDGQDVTSAIRTEEGGGRASKVAALPALRDALVAVQHNFRQAPGLIADGRDMGTVIFPDAPVKVFLTASAEERADRRYKQLLDMGQSVSLAAILREIQARDARDSNRSAAPLVPAQDALRLDTSSMNAEQVFTKVYELIQTLN